ncbi:MAG: ATPase, T2SS/T4P/T4SS family [Tissierellia bacterium]|nr:ATPase, T2SS/T4P/T4SS family [Tissierellia bacterium]
MMKTSRSVNDFLAFHQMVEGVEWGKFQEALEEKEAKRVLTKDNSGWMKKAEGILFICFDRTPSQEDIRAMEELHGPFLYDVERKKDGQRLDINDWEMLLLWAKERRATDIHVEPKKHTLIIRFRIDGVLEKIYEGPKEDTLMNIIKVQSHMDSLGTEMQDGSLVYKDLVIRSNIVPTIYGEKAVLRLLNNDSPDLRLESLGFPKDVAREYEQHVRKAGIHLVCGPTGSGKNTTLHGVIRSLPCETQNVVSIENPVEYQFEPITQLEVNEAKGRTFSKLLRSVLRQDPDILYIGEIRDEETARVAFRSALTGHVVFSTLHTKNVSSTMDRLRDLGVPSYGIDNGLRSIVCQRLIPRLCPHCREENHGKWEAKGCGHCVGGYRGRIGIFHVTLFPGGEDVSMKKGEPRVLLDYQRSAQRLLKEGIIDEAIYGGIHDL